MTTQGTGKTGLVNLGNTCFMNACIQCLAHCIELTAAYDRESMHQALEAATTEAGVAREWNKLRELMWSDDCVVSPRGFLASIHNAARVKNASLFTGFAQNDVGEFIRFLLISCIHTATASKVKMTVNGGGSSEKDKLARICYEAIAKLHSEEYSPIVEIFYGVGTSVVAQSATKKTTVEPFFILSLPVPKRPCTIYECFDMYTQPSQLDGSNQYETDDGEMVDATKQDGFWSFPEVLIIELKRFSNNLVKNNNTVDFPTDSLCLGKYAQGYDAETYNYELFGVCNHSGRICGGHYTAYARKSGGTWLHFNDRLVEPARPSQVVSANAYCLFYRKKAETASK